MRPQKSQPSQRSQIRLGQLLLYAQKSNCIQEQRTHTALPFQTTGFLSVHLLCSSFTLWHSPCQMSRVFFKPPFFFIDLKTIRVPHVKWQLHLRVPTFYNGQLARCAPHVLPCVRFLARQSDNRKVHEVLRVK